MFVPLAPVRDPALVVPMIARSVGRVRRQPRSDRCADRRQAHACRDRQSGAAPTRSIAASRGATGCRSDSPSSCHESGAAANRRGDRARPPADGGRDAVDLFLERAQAIRADVDDSPAVHELVRRLDGLPLAIELAAARVKVLGPEQLLERIAQRLDLLKGGRDADERHATLRATIAWSYDLLDDEGATAVRPARDLSRRLHARRRRGGLRGRPRHARVAVDKSLVRRRTDGDGEGRFWMLETIREFATELLRRAARRTRCGGCRPTASSSSPIAPERERSSTRLGRGTSTS